MIIVYVVDPILGQVMSFLMDSSSIPVVQLTFTLHVLITFQVLSIDNPVIEISVLHVESISR